MTTMDDTPPPGFRAKLDALLQAELRHLTTINPSDRRWQMPLAAALCSGLPLLVGAAFGRLDYGLTSSLGGMVFLYLPNTPMHHRMTTLMACGFGLAACYALGIMSHFIPAGMTLALTVIAILATMVNRFYRVAPPGSLFFIMAAAIGAYAPIGVQEVPLYVGLLTMGSLLAGLIALVYSAYILRLQAPQPVAPLPPADFDFVVFDAVVIGVFVGISLALAQALELERAYWVPISCLAVMQGASFRAVWTKQLHRILGTAGGLLLSWALLTLPLDRWTLPAVMMILAFAIETMVVRHYGIAVVFITPLTIFLAEAASLGQGPAAALVQARLWDTVLGCIVGLIGGACLHNPRFRSVVGHQIRRLMPVKLIR